MRRLTVCEQQSSRLVSRADRRAVDRDAGSRRPLTCRVMAAGPSGIDLGDPQAAVRSYSRDRSAARAGRPTGRHRRAAAGRRRGDADVRRVQLADHQVEQPAHLVGRLRAGDARRVLRAHGVPVDAVELVVVEAVAHVGPRLAEDLHLLLREVDVDLGGDGDGPRLPRLDRHRP